MTERMLGPVGSPRRRRFYGIPLALLAASVLVLGVSAAGGASCPAARSRSTPTPTSSRLHRLDWANVSDTKKNDLATGSGDDSFGQGSKEDTADSYRDRRFHPADESDLKTFGVYQEETAGGKFLHLFWTRVQDPSGTTNMDFEFNKSTAMSSNGITPVRTAGDLLITYDLSKGGTDPELSLREGPEVRAVGSPRRTSTIQATPPGRSTRRRSRARMRMGSARSIRGRSARHRSISMRSSTRASATRSVPHS